MKTKMTPKSLLSVLLAFLLAAWSVLDAHAADYRLAMSEEKEVCQLMLKFAYEGLLDTKSLQNHPNLQAPGFNFVSWGSIRLASSFQDHNGNVEGSLFDINNDGQLDWVVRIQ